MYMKLKDNNMYIPGFYTLPDTTDKITQTFVEICKKE